MRRLSMRGVLRLLLAVGVLELAVCLTTGGTRVVMWLLNFLAVGMCGLGVARSEMSSVRGGIKG